MPPAGYNFFFLCSKARRIWIDRIEPHRSLSSDGRGRGGAATTTVAKPGQRICVIGTSGAGKTYVAKALAAKLGLGYISNDALIWGPNWTWVQREARLSIFDEATRDDGWTIDGNLGTNSEDQLVWERCDTIIWLDLPRWQVHSQVLWRTLCRLLLRTRLWHGNVESWRVFFSRDSIVWWSLKTYAARRREYESVFADSYYADRVRIRLKSRGEVNRWLASIQP